MNCAIDLGFSDLPFSPIWEKGLRISRPASVAFCRVMVTALWDRRLSGFELLGINLCNLISKMTIAEHMLQGKKTHRRLCQSMAMERKVQHVDGKDVALGLIPLSWAVIQQVVYPETFSSYSCFCRRILGTRISASLSSTIVNNFF